MRIVFVTYHYWPPHFGGELKVSIERFESLVRRGHSVTVLTSGVPGLPGEEVINGIQVKRSPILHDSRFGRGLRRLAFPIWAWLQMRRMEYDILHFGGMGGIDPLTNRFGMELLNNLTHRKGAQSVWVHCLADSEEVPFGGTGYEGIMRNKALQNIDAIVSVSPALHEGVQTFFPNKARLILNGIRNDVFAPMPNEEKNSFRHEHGIEDNQVVFSFMGTISQRKGFDLLSEAFIEIIKQNPSLRLWVIGPKSRNENQNVDENAVAELTSPLDLYPKAVKYWGRIDDRVEMAHILASSDVFVFPSRKEGMPLAPMEAMASGLPLIISRIPGVTDQIGVEGITGHYVDVNNAEALRTAMTELGNDPELRQKMGQAARQRVVEQFGWNKHINDWEALYASLQK